MPEIRSNGLTLAYEAFGEAACPPVVLIMGLGMPMTLWPEPFCRMLADGGFRVIRFDNRDSGRSTKLTTAGRPNVGAMATRALLGARRFRAPYTLEDMGADTVGLLDALAIPAAHLVGVSLGGMVAQVVAAGSPARVLSLTSIMSTTGRMDLPRPKLGVLAQALRKPRRPGRARAVEHIVRTFRVIGSPGYPASEAYLRPLAEAVIDQGLDAAGTDRQFAAVLASGDRSASLAKVRAPTLVIHGDADPLVPLAGGIETARRIPSALLKIYRGMGHDLPEPLLPDIAGLILRHLRAATGAGAHLGAPEIRPREIDHLVLRAVDLPRMIAFYCEALGCTIERVREDLGLVHLRAGRSLIDLVCVSGKLGAAGGAPPGPEGRNLDHFCLRLEPFDEGAIRARLARHGASAAELRTRFGAEGEGPSMYVTDPEGNVVELKGPAG